MFSTLISVDQLQSLLTNEQAVMVFDCSFTMMQPKAGLAQYLQMHIPGAVYADLEQDLSAKDGQKAVNGGRHPLPTREYFAAWLGSVGLTPEHQVVVYDRQGGVFCGRLWWLLKWVGHEAVALLDGGWNAWLEGGGAVEVGPGKQRLATNYAASTEKAKLVKVDTVVKHLQQDSQTLIDSRDPARFRGETEPLDRTAGHIPGALNRPFAANFDANGRFKPATQLRAEFDALLKGRDPATVVHHCGSGVSVVPNIIAMEIAGLGRAPLYAGSWSEWICDPSRPVAKG